MIVNEDEDELIEERLVDGQQDNFLSGSQELFDSLKGGLVNVESLHGFSHELVEVVDDCLDADKVNARAHLVKLLAGSDDIQTDITAVKLLGFEIAVEHALREHVNAEAVVVPRSVLWVSLGGDRQVVDKAKLVFGKKLLPLREVTLAIL